MIYTISGVRYGETRSVEVKTHGVVTDEFGKLGREILKMFNEGNYTQLTVTRRPG